MRSLRIHLEIQFDRVDHVFSKIFSLGTFYTFSQTFSKMNSLEFCLNGCGKTTSPGLFYCSSSTCLSPAISFVSTLPPSPLILPRDCELQPEMMVLDSLVFKSRCGGKRKKSIHHLPPFSLWINQSISQYIMYRCQPLQLENALSSAILYMRNA